MSRPLLASLLLGGLIASAHAEPIQFAFSSTISATGFSDLAVGDHASVVVTLNNGTLGVASQTWTAADLMSIMFDFGLGTRVTTFTPGFDGGLDNSVGSFVTDAEGNLTSVLSTWVDELVDQNFETNGGGTGFDWFLNGFNAIYFEGTNNVSIANVGNLTNAANWRQVVTPAAVPEPAALALLGLGFAALAGTRRRRAA